MPEYTCRAYDFIPEPFPKLSSAAAHARVGVRVPKTVVFVRDGAAGPTVSYPIEVIT